MGKNPFTNGLEKYTYTLYAQGTQDKTHFLQQPVEFSINE